MWALAVACSDLVGLVLRVKAVGGLGRDIDGVKARKNLTLLSLLAANIARGGLARRAPAVLILGGAAVLEELARIKSGGVLAYIP